jgi:mono/diheme cytochrome c family protein
MHRTLLAAAVILSFGLGPSNAAAQAPPPDGAALYRQNCRTCHGLKGVPPQRMVAIYPTLKSLADSAYLRGRSADSIAAVMRRGAGRDMKSFADRLSPAEIAAIAKFVKTLANDSTRAP